MTLLAVSPHLDDAAFSAGGTLAGLASGGHEVVVATVFTRSVPDPTGFALKCQTDKGIPPEADYMAIRREEDRAACAALGTEAVWLDVEEAPHRGYDAPEALFAGVLPHDAGLWREVLARLRALGAARRPGALLTCQGLGNHVDHLHTIRAARALGAETGLPVLWWRDLPYAMRSPQAAPAPGLPDGLAPLAVPISPEALDAKLDACAAYATQLPYQFGRDAAGEPEALMRRRLAAFAETEGRASGAAGPAERWLAPGGRAPW